jgi:O-antigen/teichoic acid export membrane protein
MTAAPPPVIEPTAHQQPRVAVAEAGPQRIAQGGVARRILRVWGVPSALSVIDQGLTASVGFGVNLLLARWMPAEVYGAFAVAFAGFLFISGFYNAILLEPLTVLGPAIHAKRLYAYFRKQLVVHTLLVGALSAVILLVAAVLSRITPLSPLPAALFGSALALPFLLLIWLVRRMCYVLRRPSVAVLGSLSYIAFAFTGLWLLHQFHQVTPLAAFELTGTASLLAAGGLWMRIGSACSNDPLVKQELSLRQVLRENWKYGRWLVGSTALNSVSNQAQMFLVAGALGLGAAGTLRAMQTPALVMVQIIAATGLLVLPAFSYDFGLGSIDRMRRNATRVSVALTGGTLTFAALLTPFAGRAEQILFGGKYAADAWLMPILALVPAALGASTGCSMALRASQRPHFDLVASAIAAPVALISAIVLMHWWGLAGAAASVVLGYLTSSITTCWVYRASAPHAKQGITHGRIAC